MADDSAVPSRRLLIIVSTVALSLIVPLLIVAGTAAACFHRIPMGKVDPGKTTAHYSQGSIKNGELWFPMYTVTARPSLEIFRLNLKTGQQTATGLKIQQMYGTAAWLGDDLYWYTDAEICRIRDNAAESLPQFPISLGTFQSNPFIYHGELSTIHETSNADYDLIQLRNGKWTPVGKVVLPDPDAEIAAKKSATQQPRVSQTTKAATPRRLTVRSDGSNLHLFLRQVGYTGPESYYSAYRKDLEVVEPGISPGPATDWINVSPQSGTGFFYEMFLGQEGPLLISMSNTTHGRNWQYSLEQRSNDGQMHPITQQSSPDKQLEQYVHGPQVWVLADPTDQSFVLQVNGMWHREEFCPIQDSTVQSPNVTLPDRRSEYLWIRSLIGLSVPFAWLAHWSILLAGVANCRKRNEHSEFGTQVVTHAAISKRVMARAIDLSLLISTLVLSLWLHFHLVGVQWTSPTLEIWIQTLHQAESSLLMAGQFGWLTIAQSMGFFLLRQGLFGSTTEPLILAGVIVAAIADTACILWCYQTYSEGRYGCSFGKWICGIRTLRTTFRPVGFGRTIVREILRSADFPFLLTPLPAAISMMKSAACQRIGDRVADTIVIQQGSLRDHSAAKAD